MNNRYKIPTHHLPRGGSYHSTPTAFLAIVESATTVEPKLEYFLDGVIERARNQQPFLIWFMMYPIFVVA
jgi:hypothetical protein